LHVIRERLPPEGHPAPAHLKRHIKSLPVTEHIDQAVNQTKVRRGFVKFFKYAFRFLNRLVTIPQPLRNIGMIREHQTILDKFHFVRRFGGIGDDVLQVITGLVGKGIR
jgi:hypothetical protein